MFSDWVPVLIEVLAGIGLFLFLVVLLANVRLKQKNRRAEKIKLFARQSGMTYQHQLPELENLLEAFELIQKKGAVISITNVLVSRSGELTLYLFDYAWEMPGQESDPQKQTAVLFEDFRLQLAHFLLRPRRMGDFLDSLSGIRDVVPEGNRQFNRKFRLTSQTPRETYFLFTEQLVQFFLQNEKLHAEGVDTFLLLYEPGKLIEPAGLPHFLEENLKGYQYLKNAS